VSVSLILYRKIIMALFQQQYPLWNPT